MTLFRSHMSRRRKRAQADFQGYSPAEVLARYGLSKLAIPPGAKAPLIGIVELGGGAVPSNAQTASAAWGLPAANVQYHGVDGASNDPTNDPDANGEVELDIQIPAGLFAALTGLAANIAVFFCPNTVQGFADGVTAALEAGAVVISISWGGSEDSSTPSDPMVAALAACAAAGVQVFASSGDNDSNDGTGRPQSLHVDFPASCPDAIGCGGTTLTASDEVVWETTAPRDGDEGTGGGYSDVFGVPAWQVGVIPAKRIHRGVPDVAGPADPDTGWAVYYENAWQVVGGTSCVSPMWAGLAAAIACATGKPLLDLAQALYGQQKLFHDVTAGSNGAYSASVGWDPCTGLGTPTQALLEALVAHYTAAPSQAVNWPQRLTANLTHLFGQMKTHGATAPVITAALPASGPAAVKAAFTGSAREHELAARKLTLTQVLALIGKYGPIAYSVLEDVVGGASEVTLIAKYGPVVVQILESILGGGVAAA